MDDGQRKPRDTEKADLSGRIRRAADQGRISAADRDIRLRNVESAQSGAELDLMARDLDQLESAIAPGAAAPPPAPTEVGTPSRGIQVEVNRRNVVIAVVFVVIAVVGLGGLVAFRSGGGSGSATKVSDGGLLDPVPPAQTSPSPSRTDTGGTGAGQTGTGASAYGLDGRGIRWFLDAYRTRFATAEVVDLTMYDDYAVVQVPQAGTHRHAGLLYRAANGWQDFGGVTANFPGSQPVDLSRLDVPALAHNIARARRSLGVADVTQTYVIVDYRPDSDATPNVDIHVANQYGESGYLATTLEGSVERAFPYQG